MNKVSERNLKQLAENLELMLIKYSSVDDAAKALLRALSDLIQSAKNGSLKNNVENVPGRMSFTERGLSQYRDLEEAYALFKLEVTLGDFSDLY
ncbi:hypothetical protein [Shewanella surugensis]|uniref:Uncharacterized protein n=1 Tax=Shewanella surugensis TaxID=212020 RepID=A0ABT0L7D7_9GAMM|nr:hypothetical protein [Shewanella surugensis]MCL1123405.1 hypothetical protein [Shewanella surugensis]